MSSETRPHAAPSLLSRLACVAVISAALVAAGGIAATPEDPAPIDGAPAVPVEICRATRGH